MGFIRGVIAGLAMSAGAAAWYMSRAGSKFRDRYRVDRKLGELGDEIEVRTRDVRARVSAQVDEARSQAMGGTPRDAGSGTLDDAQAAAAEEAAEIAASVEAKAAKAKRAAKDEASTASESG
jgi:hypothetical protein